MKSRFISWWQDLREGFWLLPSVFLIGAILLSVVTIRIDATVDRPPLEQIGWIHAISAEGSRALLTTVAGSMMTIGGVIFSITILTLTMASTQFGPRLLKNFRRSIGNQIVLGTFIATFTYSILILRVVGTDEESAFVPHFSILVSVILALVSMAVLVYFIHHTALLLQASSVVETVYRELHRAIDRMYPEHEGASLPPEEGREHVPPDFEERAVKVRSAESGFVQSVDLNSLAQLAADHDLILRIDRRPGKFAAEGSLLVLAYGESPKEIEQISHAIRDAFIYGPERQHVQDIEFSIEQLVEIAVRALSPSVNDPFTAMACLERLGAAYGRLSCRKMPSSYRLGPKGQLRLIAPHPTFAGMLDCGFNQIRQYGRNSPAVMIRLLETLDDIADNVEDEAKREALYRQGSMAGREAMRCIAEQHDRADIRDRYLTLCRTLKREPDAALPEHSPLG